MINPFRRRRVRDFNDARDIIGDFLDEGPGECMGFTVASSKGNIYYLSVEKATPVPEDR